MNGLKHILLCRSWCCRIPKFPRSAVAGLMTRNSCSPMKPITLPSVMVLQFSPLPPGYANYTHQMQFFGHEEGRARAIRPTPQITTAITVAYDYMLIDHLGTPRGRGVWKDTCTSLCSSADR
jgi:hypothetical protein